MNSDNSKEILMPDDNANALEVICNIMHLWNDAVPHRESARDPQKLDRTRLVMRARPVYYIVKATNQENRFKIRSIPYAYVKNSAHSILPA